MAKRRSAPRSSPGSNRLVAAILLLLLAFGVLLFQQYHAQTAEQQVQAPRPSPASAPSDDFTDRILFGGLPRPRHAPAGTHGGTWDTKGSDPLDVRVLKNIAYISGYSESRKNPLWVGYRVFNIEKPYFLPRPAGGFIPDTRISVRVEQADYARTGYDRGHLAPNGAIARCYGPDAQLETFLLTNISPQAPLLNGEVWERLESAERLYVDTLQEIWVITGPIFADLQGGKTQRLASGIAVPSAFYKILIDDENSTSAGGGQTAAVAPRPRLFAVIMPQNVKGTELPQQFVTSVREIENQTGFDFLWNLDDATEEALESRIWPMWPRRR